MVEIAYKNRLPYSRFIHNADELIDEFNEEKFRKFFYYLSYKFFLTLINQQVSAFVR